MDQPEDARGMSVIAGLNIAFGALGGLFCTLSVLISLFIVLVGKIGQQPGLASGGRAPPGSVPMLVFSIAGLVCAIGLLVSGQKLSRREGRGLWYTSRTGMLLMAISVALMIMFRDPNRQAMLCMVYGGLLVYLATTSAWKEVIAARPPRRDIHLPILPSPPPPPPPLRRPFF